MIDLVPETRDAGAEDAIHSALAAAVCVPTERYLWTPSDAITFAPALSNTVYGDGRALMHITTINNRPAYYVVRVDSRWTIDMDRDIPDDAPAFVDFIDYTCERLEEEFGCARGFDDDDEEIEQEPREWPAFDYGGGCMWGRARWPALPGIKAVPHPLSWFGDLLPDSAILQQNLEVTRWADDGGRVLEPAFD